MTFAFAHLRQPIATAPRNGLTVIVGDDDCGQFAMHWSPTGTNPLVQEGLGIWESLDRSFTWSEADGAGPTYWFPLPAESGAQGSEPSCDEGNLPPDTPQ